MSIAENIKRLREEYGLTQEELARIAGVTDKSVSKWELGKSEPRFGAVCKIAAYFNISRLKIAEDFDKDYPVSEGRKEDDIFIIYGMLNDEGKDEVLRYVRYIASIDEYRKDK